jgi:hypothetical protein
MRQAGVMRLPGPVRAAIGLVATATEEARHLPERAIELPMLAVSTALQMSLRAQQRYARLTARGDEVLRGQPSDDPPEWATFDDPVPTGELHDTAFDRMDGHGVPDLRSFADLFAVTDPGERAEAAPDGSKAQPTAAPNSKPAAKKAAAKKTAKKPPAAAKKPAAKTASAQPAVRKAPEKTAAQAPAKSTAKAPVKKASVKKASVKKASVKKAPAGKAAAKQAVRGRSGT